ncbi:radical SAM protein [Pontibaca salina]|uniref:Radical SAM protein n=1 Tax=Pontibaca salina TaxID=2795731 RepID=A0A934HUQ7_9RHOB|nr:radical SAM protein [Pontibaca salina]MBI6629904.1 radical SAM protein [Pontibaca salina]
MKVQSQETAHVGKFENRYITADGQPRASVALRDPQTLWFNTGTLCNIECVNCYIASSPTNDALAYLTAAEIIDYLDQIQQRGWPVREIGFTGGEPFMNPQIIDMAGAALERGYRVLILTNAMRPMMRDGMRSGLAALQRKHGSALCLRISLDHYRAELHDSIRGKGSHARTLEGMAWLRDNNITMTVAGRTIWQDSEAESRAGYARFFAAHGFNIDAHDPAQMVLFPEMDETVKVPEITTSCWDILNVAPSSVMCASARMVVKRKGAKRPTVLACTLLPYSPEFELGETLAEAEGDVYLNHPHCARFCVLGGASCSG